MGSDKRPEVVFLRWFDSAIGPSTAVYTPEDIQAETLIILETVGWLVNESYDPHGGHFTLATSRHGDVDFRGIQLIPRANVIEFALLGPKLGGPTPEVEK